MKKKKSIVRELYRYIINDLEMDEAEQKEKFKRIRFPRVVINQIYELFIMILEKEFEIKLEKDNQDLYRLFAVLQTNIPLLHQNFEEEEQNIDFLYDLLNSYFEKKIMK